MCKKLTSIIAGAVIALFAGTAALAADANYDIEVVNNVGRKDTVAIQGVEPRSTVTVHNDKGVLLGKKTAGSKATEVNLTVALPGSDGGKITVSVLEKGAETAEKIDAEYSAEPVSDVPAASDVTISNNVDKKATVYIENLEPKDAVTVYSEAGKKIASGKVGSSKDELTLNCKQLSKEGGKLYISVKSLNKLESARAAYNYTAQDVSDILSKSDIEVTNTVGKKGTIKVTGLDSGSVVTVYNVKNKKIGSAKCGNNKDEVSISVTLEKLGGDVYIVLKEANKLPSAQLQYTYDGQPQTEKVDMTEIDITANPVGVKDELYVEGVEAGDIIKVYKDETGSSTVLKGTVGANANGNILLTKASLGTGKLWITNTRKGMLESGRVAIDIPGVKISDTVNVGTETVSGENSIETVSGDVTVTNYAGMSGTVYIKGLREGSVITIYNKEKNGSKLGSGTVVSSDAVSVSVSQLAKNGGKLWISRKDPDENESARVSVQYGVQVQAGFTYETGDIDIANNSGTAGVITVRNVDSGDTVKVYLSKTASSAIATGTCSNNGFVTISTTKLSSKGGLVYLTLTKPGYLESDREEIDYAAENASDPIPENSADVDNNTGVSSTVTVNNLEPGDVVYAYSSMTATSSIGTGTVPANYRTVTFNISNLKAAGGEIYISRKSSGCAESTRAEIRYGAIGQTDKLNGGIKILNNSGAQGTVTVRGLSSGDVVKVYKAATGGSAIGTGTAAADGSVSIGVPQLMANGGELYISVTSSGKLESARVEAEYLPQSEAPLSGNITVINHAVISSIVSVSGLNDGDEVTVYSSSTAATPIGGATAIGSSVDVKVGQLNEQGGYIYVTVTTPGRCESSRTSRSYAAQKASDAPANATIYNIKNDRAIVLMTGLEANDFIQVYNDPYGNSFLGSATASNSELVFEINKLGDTEGTVYITRTSLGMTESSKTAFKYGAAQVLAE